MTEPEPAHCYHCGGQLGYLSFPYKGVKCKKCRRVYAGYRGRRKGLVVLTIETKEPRLISTE